MTIKNSGSSLSFTEISNEFGLPPNKNLGAYRISDNIGSLTLPLDSGIPSSGEIKFSDFYGKKLNIVVKCTGGNRASANYNGDGVVVGGFRSKPSRNSTGWQGGKKIFINITGTYSSYGASPQEWAFKTGNSSYWPSETSMIIDVSSDGQVVGRGGNGGGESGNGGAGSNGLRYLSGAALNNNGYISAGGGGGGGGSHAEQNDWGDKNDAEGGGGGGGNGLPAGSGGFVEGNGTGGAGSLKNGGEGREGESDAEAEGGDGGDGGSNGGNGGNASGGNNKTGENGTGGAGGTATEAY